MLLKFPTEWVVLCILKKNRFLRVEPEPESKEPELKFVSSYFGEELIGSSNLRTEIS
jgi:hypothetical protein